MDAKIVEQINRNHIEFVQLESIDLNGISRSVIAHSEHFLRDYKSGIYNSPECLSVQVSGEFVSNTELSDLSNAKLLPDLNTFRILPWLDSTASVLCEFDHLVARQASPRWQCQIQLEKLAKIGYQMYNAFEYEFYLVDAETLEPVCKDVSFASTVTANKLRPVMYDVMRNLRRIDIEPEIFKPVDGPFELTLAPEFGLKSVDNTLRYKESVKAVAEKHGMKALFLSKPYLELPESSCHFNHSLWDLSGKRNAFSDLSKGGKLSGVCKNWIGGLQEHSKALMALQYLTVNCFERFKPGTHVPSDNSWGYDNRSVCFRVKNLSPSSTYIENRIPGSGCNPYLVTTGCLIAGMDGVKRNLQPKSEPFIGNLRKSGHLPEGIERLPDSLEQALRCLKDDEVFVGELGDIFMKAYIALKEDEMRRWKTFRNKEKKWDFYRKILGQYL